MYKVSVLDSLLHGSWLQQGLHEYDVDTLITDSRKISHPESSIFIALETERRDGHDFIESAFEAGIRCFIVSKEVSSKKVKHAWICKVQNTLVAMQLLAENHRKQFAYPVIGITGSNGKTVVKELLFQLLEHDYKIVRSPKSFNSQIGVPLSLWQMEQDHNLAIIEAGISQSGEMAALEKMIKPNIGIFTNIGEMHNEGFMDIRHKINEKLGLFKDTDVLIYNKDYPELHDAILQFANRRKERSDNEIKLLSWSKKSEANIRIEHLEKNMNGASFDLLYNGEQAKFNIPFADDAYIEDTIHCLCVGILLKVPMTSLVANVSNLQPTPMRLELKKGINRCILINDSYSSDISSLVIALDFLTQQGSARSSTLILSDIVQSGRDNDLYQEVADLLVQKKISKFIGIGNALIKNKSLFRKNRRMHSEFYKSTEDFLDSMDSTNFSEEIVLVKGARKFTFEKIVKRLEERIHQTVMEVNLGALVHNLKVYQSYLKPKTKVMAMVKAFSYGSGSFEVSNKLQFEGVHYLAVAYTDEGIELRKHTLKLPIMVMNPDENSFDNIIEWKLEPEIFNHKMLDAFLKVVAEFGEEQYPIHIKLDTGMHRLGFELEQIPELLSKLHQNPLVKVMSVFSHLSGSEEKELDDFTKRQAAEFVSMCTTLEQGLGYTFIKHLCNSSGIVRHPELHFDMVRLGIGLYGVDSGSLIQSKLRNVGHLKTIISQLKHVPKEETVGYNRKGVLDRDTTIGTICIGYADGIPRRLGNGRGKMHVNGHLVPIVGNVCMDMCMLDVTDVPNIKEGDEVVVFGEALSVKDMAVWADTIPYEILTGISTRVKRVYYEE